jgi:hypothetical protein
MAVVSTKPYVGVPRDLVANFNGKQLVYVCWDQHLLFAAPFPVLSSQPEMSFRELLDGPLTASDPARSGCLCGRLEQGRMAEDRTSHGRPISTPAWRTTASPTRSSCASARRAEQPCWRQPEA